MQLLGWAKSKRISMTWWLRELDNKIFGCLPKHMWTCNHERTVLCMTSWIVNKRPRTASCSWIISLVLFLIPSSKPLVVLPRKCRRSSNTISSLAWSDHFTLITCKINYRKESKLKFYIVTGQVNKRNTSHVGLQKMNLYACAKLKLF